MTASNDYTIRVTDWETDCEQLYAVRRTVFIDEQGVPPELEQDQHDPGCWHVLVTAAGQAIATGRLLPDGHIGRVAVLAAWRGRGIGEAVMRRLLALAKEQGIRQVELNAQLPALAFYRRLGFSVYGDQFLDAGIPHRAMRLDLSAASTSDSDAGRELSGVDDSLAAALSLVNNARRQLCIYTPYMHPTLYGDVGFAAALRRRVTDQPRIRCRLLLPAPGAWRRDCPRLAELVERLSMLELRGWPARRARERAEFSAGMVIADDGSDASLLLHTDPRSCLGRFCPRGGREAGQWLNFFNEVWEHSERDTELRRLGI